MESSRILFLLFAGSTSIGVVDAFPSLNSITKHFSNEIKDSLLFPAEAMAFVTDQFDNWKEKSNCQAFVDSFTEPFQYCDATFTCIHKKQDLFNKCNSVAGLAGNVSELKIKPNWKPEPVYNDIAIVGRQNLEVIGIGVACFEFAVIQQLEKTPRGITSRLWKGFYTMEVGGCGWQRQMKHAAYSTLWTIFIIFILDIVLILFLTTKKEKEKKT